MDEASLKEIGKKLSNWGKWGPDDELGTVNYITPQKIVQACRLAKLGKTFSLAIPFDREGPQTGKGWRVNPIHLMTVSGADDLAGAQRGRGSIRAADDYIIMPLQSATHWDALAHVFYDGMMYNGHPSRLVTSFGAAKNSIDKIIRQVVSRGLLLDIPGFKGVEALEPGYGITPDDLDGCASQHGVAIEPGDILLVRTGHMARFYATKKWETYTTGSCPGLSWTTAPWLHEKQIAAVASDVVALEVRPGEIPDASHPLHMLLLRDMGMLVGEMFYLDELAADCAADGGYEFLFVAQPLPITGAVGSPVNPLAIK